MAIITATATAVTPWYDRDGVRQEFILFTGAIDGHPAEMEVSPPPDKPWDPMDYLGYVTEVFEHFYCEDDHTQGVVE